MKPGNMKSGLPYISENYDQVGQALRNTVGKTIKARLAAKVAVIGLILAAISPSGPACSEAELPRLVTA
jgi:hypothetical protein